MFFSFRPIPFPSIPLIYILHESQQFLLAHQPPTNTNRRNMMCDIEYKTHASPPPLNPIMIILLHVVYSRPPPPIPSFPANNNQFLIATNFMVTLLQHIHLPPYTISTPAPAELGNTCSWKDPIFFYTFKTIPPNCITFSI